MQNLQPAGVWSAFHSLTQIPRPSGKKEQVHDFLMNYGKSLGLETLTDEIGNVLIRKPASPCMENHPGVILQGHMDMVPQKNGDKVFNFETDPIEAYIEDNGDEDCWICLQLEKYDADGDMIELKEFATDDVNQEELSKQLEDLLHFYRRNWR